MAAQPHYHIRWSDTGDLDWQVFDTAAEANSAATSIVLRGETYVIEETGETCSHCTGLELNWTHVKPGMDRE